MKSTNKPIKVTPEEINMIIDKYKPLGLFIAKCDNVFIAVDNKSGDAWTQEFKKKKKALKWLTKYN